MTPESFTAWRLSTGLGVKDAAEALGVSGSTLQRYESGRMSIPLSIDLATRYLSLRRSFDLLNNGS